MNDKEIRDILVQSIKKSNPSIKESKNLIVQEMVLCKGYARIDVALVNGHMHGFEIKSDVDTLTRLPSQLSYYSKCFDYITIVTSEKHFSNILKNYPSWLGIYITHNKKGKIILQKVRSAKKNNYLEVLTQLQLLWKNELHKIAEKYCYKNLNINYSKSMLMEHLLVTVNKNTLKTEVREALKKRVTWAVAEFV